MRESKTPRVVAAVFIGLIFGAYRHFQQVKWLANGRDSYLVDQGKFFDRITQTHSAGFMLIAGVILSAVVFGVYEVIAAGFARLIPPVEVEE
jgi:hypothetical protein